MKYKNSKEGRFETWAAEDEDVVVLLTCPGCGATYEVGASDLLDIQSNGQVTCECGASISTRTTLVYAWDF